MIKIIIADDHEIVLDGLELVIKNDHNIEIVGRALTGTDVISIVNTKNVDIVVLDINMPIMDGIETTKFLKKNHPEIKILILSMHEEISFIRSIFNAEANGYILKNKGKEELLSAIYSIHNGKDYFSEEVTQSIYATLKSKDVVGEIKLTEKEKQVLTYIGNGYTGPEIADKLNIAKTTFETHKRNLIEKTGVRNSNTLIKFAIENGYCNPI